MKKTKTSSSSNLVNIAQQEVTNYAIGDLANHNNMVPKDMKAEGMANLNNKVEANSIINKTQVNKLS